jgi:hypothetical protein
MTPDQENQVSPLVGDPSTPEVENTEDAPATDQSDLQASADDVDAANAELAEEEAPVVEEAAPAAPEMPEQPTAHAPQVEAPVEDERVRYDKRAHRMKEVLQSQPQVKFAIPLAMGEKKGAYETVQINGYKLTIMKGVMVDLPQQVVELLSDKYQISLEAGSEHRIDADEQRADALS